MPQNEKFAQHLPLLPLKDIVVFPQMILPVFVSEDICMRAIETALGGERHLFLSAFQADGGTVPSESAEPGSMARDVSVTLPAPFDVYDIGTVATVMRTRKLPDGRMKVLVQGLSRAQIVCLSRSEPYPEVQLLPLSDGLLPPVAGLGQAAAPEAEALGRTVREQLEKIVGLGKNLSPDILMVLEDVNDPGRLADLVASHMGLKVLDAQRILGQIDPLQRLKRIHGYLCRELEVYQMQVRIQSQAKDEMNRAQREHFLREQMKAIKSELGDADGKDDLEELKEKVRTKALSAEARAECQKQLRRLERMHQDTSEATLTRTYLEWMLDLPWDNLTPTQHDLLNCKKILDEDHYGLEKVKDRILEYIAVKKLNPDAKAPIICFVGPPGVGKTSLGRSIAKAVNRKFARISLGGVRDEAEIRGHRRTYVGALPGRIVQAIKQAGTRNPLIMLDEIDKLNSDYKGDPSSALLEVLDPEQNHNFSDHYISVPFDLSQVMFIANANRLDTIPAPLRDRLEIIEVGGYSEEEKIEICKQHIIPKTIRQSGLSDDLLSFVDSAVSFLIQGYTREAGLRNLEKSVASLVRKIARATAENDEKGKERKSVRVSPKMVRELLGEDKLIEDDHDPHATKVGVATGLAYTSGGGEVLDIEVNLIPGKGALTVTGQLGDVMKESALTALCYVRSRAYEFGISLETLQNYDVHVHVPAGAVPKDGPSAGVALAAALVSCYLGEPLRQDVAMTGEISLHGKVLPVGGLREKILAALRVGIQTVCVPERNRGLVSELPVSLRKKADIRFVTHVFDVLDVALLNASLSTSMRARFQRSQNGVLRSAAAGDAEAASDALGESRAGGSSDGASGNTNSRERAGGTLQNAS